MSNSTTLDHDTLMQLAADAGLYPENINGLDSQLYTALRAVERAARAAERGRCAGRIDEVAEALELSSCRFSETTAILSSLSAAIRRDPPEPEGQHKALWLALGSEP